MENDFSYYREVILDSEVDSSLLPDFEAQGFEEGQCLYEIPGRVVEAVEGFCAQHHLSILDVAKAALLILLEKYTNNAASLVAMQVQGQLFPIFVSSEKTPAFLDYLASLLEQVENAPPRHRFSNVLPRI